MKQKSAAKKVSKRFASGIHDAKKQGKQGPPAKKQKPVISQFGFIIRPPYTK
jgi:hypothetical protein